MNNCTVMNNCFFKTAAESSALLVLRLFIAYEYFEAGLEKFHGENWFGSVADQFPFPFNSLPPDLNWYVAMGSELLLPILLVLGLFTRFSIIGLMILTSVAWYTIHAASGYNVCDNGYKLVLMYLIMMLPLLIQGAGLFSIDFQLRKKCATKWSKYL